MLLRAVAFLVLTASLPVPAGVPAADPTPTRLVVQTGNQGIARLRFAPDGRSLIEESASEVVRIWDLPSGRLRHVLPGRAAAVSPDGKLIATGSWSQSLQVWDAVSGARRFDLATRNVQDLAFSRDGSRLLAACLNQGVRVWDARTGELVFHAPVEEPQSVWRVVETPDGSLLLGAGTGRVWIWEAATGRLRQVLTGHRELVDDLAIAPDGSFLVTGSRDGTARIWRFAHGEERALLTGHQGGVSSVAISPDGSLVLTGADDGVRVWDAATGALVQTFRGHTHRVAAVAAIPGAGLSAGDSRVLIWDPRTGALRRELKQRGWVSNLELSPDGRWIAAAADGAVILWDQSADLAVRKLGTLGGNISSLSFTPDGGALLTAGRETLLWDLAAGGAPVRLGGNPGWRPPTVVGGTAILGPRVVDRATGRLLRTLPLDGRSRVTVSADGSLALSGAMDGTVRLWDVATGRDLATMQGPSTIVTQLAIAPDNSFVATGGADGTVTVWSAAGKLLHTLAAASDPVMHLEIAPDGSFLAAAGSNEPALRLWDLRSGQLRHVFEKLAGGVRALAISPDGRRVAAATGRGPQAGPAVWDTGSGELLFHLRGHETMATSLAYSPDGRFLVTGGSDDRTARLWDAATGAPLAVFRGHLEEVDAVAVSPSSRFVAGAGADGRVLLWDAEAGAELASLYTFEGGDWLIATADGRWNASRTGELATVTVWQGDRPAPLSAHPNPQTPGLLAQVLQGRLGVAALPPPPPAARPAQISSTQPLRPASSPIPAPAELPLTLRIAGRLPLAGCQGPRVRVAGGHAYVTAGSEGLMIVDLSAPAELRLTGRHRRPSDWTRNVALAGGRAFLPERDGLLVLDVSDPTTPALVTTLDAERAVSRGGISDVAIAGSHAYFVRSLGGLLVAEVSTPGLPRIVGSFDARHTLGQILNVSVEGRYAYLAEATLRADDLRFGLHILDVSNPAHPRSVGFVPTAQRVRTVAAAGPRLYAAASDSGLLVYDAADPAAPRLLGHYDTPSAEDVVIDGQRLYLADGILGLLIFDISDPVSPALIGRSVTAGATGIALAGDRLVVVGNSGIYLLEIP